MTKEQVGRAREMAMSEQLPDVDDSVLSGLYLPSFVSPVYTTIRVVARAMQDYIQFNGKWDESAIEEFCKVARTKIRILV